MSLKKEIHRRKFVLGFDETNNGYHLKSFNPNSEAPMIITGYLAENPRANYGSCKYEADGKLFNEKRPTQKSLERALKRGRDYIQRYPNFLYTVIPEDFKKETSIHALKANAIALLTFEFFLRYDLNPNEFSIIADEMDNENNSLKVNYFLNHLLERSNLKLPCFSEKKMIHESKKIPYRSKRSADKNVIAVKKAHTVGRYLGAIHFYGKNSSWPYSDRKLNLNQLEDKCMQAFHNTLKRPS